MSAGSRSSNTTIYHNEKIIIPKPPAVRICRSDLGRELYDTDVNANLISILSILETSLELEKERERDRTLLHSHSLVLMRFIFITIISVNCRGRAQRRSETSLSSRVARNGGRRVHSINIAFNSRVAMEPMGYFWLERVHTNTKAKKASVPFFYCS